MAHIQRPNGLLIWTHIYTHIQKHLYVHCTENERKNSYAKSKLTQNTNILYACVRVCLCLYRCTHTFVMLRKDRKSEIVEPRKRTCSLEVDDFTTSFHVLFSMFVFFLLLYAPFWFSYTNIYIHMCIYRHRCLYIDRFSLLVYILCLALLWA